MLVNGRSPGLLRASPHRSSISSSPLGPPPSTRREYRHQCIEGEPAVSTDRAFIMMDDGDSSVGRRGQSLPAPHSHSHYLELHNWTSGMSILPVGRSIND